VGEGQNGIGGTPSRREFAGRLGHVNHASQVQAGPMAKHFILNNLALRADLKEIERKIDEKILRPTFCSSSSFEVTNSRRKFF
jgi:hypothetical protein